MAIVFRGNIKVSIVIPCFNSHEAVRRQVLYFHLQDLPPDVEIILMDDGSDPPLKPLAIDCKNLNIYPTGDFRPWTQTAAKNLGVKIAEGEYVFITDIDHIITRDALEAVRNFDGDKMVFPRQWGVITEEGIVTQDKDVLMDYGMREIDWIRKGVNHYIHTNTYAMKRSVYIQIGGYDPVFAEMQKHDIYDDNWLYGRYRREVKIGKAKPAVEGPPIFTFPGTVKNLKGLFHNMGFR